MTYFAVENLTELKLSPSVPQQFSPAGEIPAEARSDKQARQTLFKDPSFRHQFYTTVEPSNPNRRISKKDNPPRLLHGIVADYDLPMPLEEILAAAAKLPVKPAWVEISLGGNFRLIWEFPRPLPAESYDFCVALLLGAADWLQLDRLPGLDRPAFEDPARLYCNGCAWTPTGHGPVDSAALQQFFVATGKAYRFTSDEAVRIPLDAVYTALREKYPTFAWDGDFEAETTGPSFWVPGSTSPKSAILKPEGFYTFAGHAEKVFYTWADLLGAEFVAQYTAAAIEKATSDVWFDGRKFWRQKKGAYTAMEKEELTNYLKIDCGILAKDDAMAEALSHIYNENFVENASPYIFQPPGLLIYQGKRRLNTSKCEVLQPAAGAQTWGDTGEFPFLSRLLDNIFTSDFQRDYFLAWFQHFYATGLNLVPAPGPVVFLMGGVGTGKTLMSREVVGRAVGGFADAASFLIRGGEFNSHLFEVPLWSLDDDTVADSPAASANVQAMLKKSVANNAFLVNKKFQNAGMIEWSGRIIATTNLDYISSRMLGPLNNGSLDKVSVLRCQTISRIQFPCRAEVSRLVNLELPYFLRWLVDHVPPEIVVRNPRFGYDTYQEPSLMEQAGQTSYSAPFKEILLETLEEYFAGNPDAVDWRGTVSRLIILMHNNPTHECVLRTLRLEQAARHLEAVERDGALGCFVETTGSNVRTWVFPRPAEMAPRTAPAPALPPQEPGIFGKQETATDDTLGRVSEHNQP